VYVDAPDALKVYAELAQITGGGVTTTVGVGTMVTVTGVKVELQACLTYISIIPIVLTVSVHKFVGVWVAKLYNIPMRFKFTVGPETPSVDVKMPVPKLGP
jgi:hypothetical protein